jgi:two-component system response regulator AtoC
VSRILIIDDDKALARSLEIHLSGEGHETRRAHTLAEGWKRFVEDPDDVVFLDLKLPDGDSRELLGRIREHTPTTAVIMITGHQDMQATIDAIRAGAFDYIRKPLDLDQILGAVAKAEAHGKRGHETPAASALPEGAPRPREIVGRSLGTMEILKQIAILSQSRVTVLIQGETGTGKELVARALHEASGTEGPFVAVNCGGIVPTLLESELFGHEKGSFTGASNRKVGKLELAGTGTIFFDEVGDLSLDLQAKLLRALQEAEFERVGGTQTIPLKARVMAATHRDLDRRVAEGTFRQDLFYRLAVARVRVPALRERPEDVPLIAEFLLHRIGEQLGRPPANLTPEAMKRLQAHPWPGNVRELENVLTRSVALLRSGVIGPDDLAIEPAAAAMSPTGSPDVPILSLRDMEKRYVAEILDRLDWNITRTAEALAISPTTLRKKITDYDLKRTPPGRPTPPDR